MLGEKSATVLMFENTGNDNFQIKRKNRLFRYALGNQNNLSFEALFRLEMELSLS